MVYGIQLNNNTIFVHYTRIHIVSLLVDILSRPILCYYYYIFSVALYCVITNRYFQLTYIVSLLIDILSRPILCHY